MGGEWVEVPLGDYVGFASGGTPSKARADYWLGSVPWISAKDMKRFRLEDSEDHISEEAAREGTRLAPSGSVLLLTRGMTLLNDIPICVLTRPMTFNQDIKALTVRDGLVADFLPYLLLGNKERLLALVDLAGHGTGRLNTDELKSLPVLLPPIGQQAFIAHILATLDDKIDLNRRMSETLEAMARALFKSWFVDFDPVRAKQEGRDSGLPAELAALFPWRLVESELGEIPEGWGVGTIGDLTEVIGGTTPSTKNPAFWEGGTHAWATPKDLSGLAVPVLLGTERQITDAGLGQIGSGLLPAGTVLLSSRAPIGYLAIAEMPVAINQGFIAMRPKPGMSSLYLLLWARAAHEDILSRANGSTFQEVSKSNFRQIPVVIPPREVVEGFDRLATPVYQRIVSNVREGNRLAAMRDVLLPRLISGDLRIQDAERFVQRVTA